MIKKVFVTKIVEEEHEVFTFDELSKGVQEKLIEKYREERDESDFSLELEEMIDSFKAIAEHCGFTYNYAYDVWRGQYTRLTTNAEIDELIGVRAYAYVWNNYIEPNLKSKFLGYRNDKFYYSKLTKEMEYPFTGTCFDYALFEAFNRFKDNFTLNSNVDDFISILEDVMNQTVQSQLDFIDSDEYIIDRLDDYYFADGEIADVVK